MTLDDGAADVIRFECESCRTEHTPRALRKQNGICRKCSHDTWTMTTEYQEVEHNVEPLSLAMAVFGGLFPIILTLLGVGGAAQSVETIRIVTETLPADEAFAIANGGSQRGQMAFRYMELRRDLESEREREVMREQGGENCKICGVFFMPNAEKPWTSAACCSKACFAATTPAAPPAHSSPSIRPAPVVPGDGGPTVKSAGKVTVTCPCGNEFAVARMYIGTNRPCPKCQVASMVGE